MKKKELKALRVVKATALMRRLAIDDPIVKTERGSSYYKWTKESRKYKFFLRAIIEKNILKVGIFLHEHLDTGGKLPAFELYVSRDERRWLTHDRITGKWRTAKINLLNWPQSVYNSQNVWIKPTDADIIKNYLDTERFGYDGLIEYQQKTEEENLKRRHKKETDPWDAAMAQVPEVPKDWARWASKTGIPDHYIYYQYTKKGATHGYCTHCGKDVPIKHPRHNQKGICTRCRHEITFKAAGRAGRVITNTYYLYLLQHCKNGNGFVLREFQGHRIHPKDCYTVPDCWIHEIRRTFYDKTAKNPKSYYWGCYKMIESRWIGSIPCTFSFYGEEGKVYPRTLAALVKKELRLTGLVEAIRSHKIIDPEKYLAIYQRIPQLEQIAKAGLQQLANECYSASYAVSKHIISDQASSLTKALGIDTQRLKRLRVQNGGWRMLEWLQFEKLQQKCFPDEVISWFCQEQIVPKDLKFIQSKMSLTQIYNYIRRQISDSGQPPLQVLRTWEDYLSMAKVLGINTDDEIVYRARNLRQRHNELVLRLNQREFEREIKKNEAKFPRVSEVCRTLTKYEYANDVYAIVAPTGIRDIMREGRLLNHCVSNGERYLDRISRKEAFILFLRKVDHLQNAYYTLEIEPDGTIRQKRTFGDDQLEDINAALPFLEEWQKVIAQRLSAEDQALSKRSRLQRLEEFAELKSNKKIIHFGAKQGQPLFDVLLADLVENKFADAA